MPIPTSTLSDVCIDECRLHAQQPTHIDDDILIKHPLSTSSSSSSSSPSSPSTSSSPSPCSPPPSLCPSTSSTNTLIKPWQCCPAHHLMLSTRHLNLCFAHFSGGSSTAPHSHPYDNVALSLLPGTNAVESVYDSDLQATPKLTRTFSVNSGSVFTSFAPHYHHLTAPKDQALAFISVEATLPCVPRERGPPKMPVVELLRGWRNEKNEGMCENSQGNVQVKHLQSASFYSAVEMVVNAADDATVVVSFDRARTTMTKATGDDTNSDEQAQENDNHHQQNTDIVIVARLICKLRHSFDHVHISHDCNTTSSNSSSAIRVDRVRRTFKQADMETVVIHGFADMGMHEDVGVTQLRSSSKGEWSAVVIDLYARRQ